MSMGEREDGQVCAHCGEHLPHRFACGCIIAWHKRTRQNVISPCTSHVGQLPYPTCRKPADEEPR